MGIAPANYIRPTINPDMQPLHDYGCYFGGDLSLQRSAMWADWKRNGILFNLGDVTLTA
jgi:hypothetical protein